MSDTGRPLDIAVVGSGISGLSAAWLLSTRHRVTLYEADGRLGGHANTVLASVGEAASIPVDTGFIVYNEPAYPNLTALFRHLDVATKPSDMSFSVSLDGGRLEYSGSGVGGLFAQPANLARPRFWAMLRELLRFYREAPRDLPSIGEVGLGDYLDRKGYGPAFREDHLYPMAAAIWSSPAAGIGSYPAAAFIRFCANHGLLKLAGRPVWRTVDGGSHRYVERLLKPLAGRVLAGRPVRAVTRSAGAVDVTDAGGERRRFDHVVIAAHADQALRMLADPTPDETGLLGAFPYGRNEAVLHRDPRLMPRRRRVWSSWNYICGPSGETAGPSVTYWMNRLQGIPERFPLFLTLNPNDEPRPDTVIRRQTYEHPLFDLAAMRAQEKLWALQGVRNTWFCGAYFGSGFHEDGLQAGLAVAEALGGVSRPWTVADPSGRIRLGPVPRPVELAAA